MYKITFKNNKTQTTLALKEPKFYLEWQEDIFKHFIYTDLDKWNQTIEVITSSPEPFKDGNFVPFGLLAQKGRQFGFTITSSSSVIKRVVLYAETQVVLGDVKNSR